MVPPSELKLHFRNPEGRDPLTPSRVRDRYTGEASDGHFVLWGVPEEQLVGIKHGIDELVLKDDEFDFIRFYRVLPAKGSGSICLETNSPWRVLIDSKGHSDELESWTRKHLLPALLTLLPNRVVEVDGGFDA